MKIMRTFSKLPPIIDTHTLKTNIGQFKIFDASWYMPSRNRNTYQEFLQARIPNSMFFNIDQICDQNTTLPHMLPSKQLFLTFLSKFQIHNHDQIVVYDTQGMFSAPRCYMTFKIFGHENVAVLDGGLPKWIKDYNILESGPEKENTSQWNGYKIEQNESRVWTYENVQQLIKMHRQGINSHILVDVRGKGRFDGTQPEPRPIKNGHMPFSVNLPFEDILNQDMTYKSKDEIRSILKTKGIDIEKQIVITSCGTGVTSCILSVGLDIIGVKYSGLYDGSWTEYAQMKDAEIIQS